MSSLTDVVKVKLDQIKSLDSSYRNYLKAFWILVIVFVIALLLFSPLKLSKYRRVVGTRDFLNSVENLWKVSRNDHALEPDPDSYMKDPSFDQLPYPQLDSKSREAWCPVYESAFVNFGDPGLTNMYDRALIFATDGSLWIENRTFFEDQGLDLDSLIKQVDALKSDLQTNADLVVVRAWHSNESMQFELDDGETLSSEKERIQNSIESYESEFFLVDFKILSLKLGPLDLGKLIGVFLAGLYTALFSCARKMESLRTSLLNQHCIDPELVVFPGLAALRPGFRLMLLVQAVVVATAIYFLPSVLGRALNGLSVFVAVLVATKMEFFKMED